MTALYAIEGRNDLAIWVDRYKEASGKTAAAMLKQATIVRDALAAGITHRDYAKALGISHSAVTQLASIANDSRLVNRVNHLPTTWSVLYQCSRLTDAELQQVRPEMTRRQIVAMRKTATKKQKEAAVPHEGTMTAKAEQITTMIEDGLSPRDIDKLLCRNPGSTRAYARYNNLTVYEIDRLPLLENTISGLRTTTEHIEEDVLPYSFLKYVDSDDLRYYDEALAGQRQVLATLARHLRRELKQREGRKNDDAQEED